MNPTHRRLGGVSLRSDWLAGPEEENGPLAGGGDGRGIQVEVGTHKLCRPEAASTAPADHLRLGRKEKEKNLRTIRGFFFSYNEVANQIDSKLLKFIPHKKTQANFL